MAPHPLLCAPPWPAGVVAKWAVGTRKATAGWGPTLHHCVLSAFMHKEA